MSIKKAKKENVCIEDILRALSDNEALVLFNTIALAEGTQIQIQNIGLTRRQYYAKLSKLTESDLITRKNGRFFLTLLGKIMYEIHMTSCEVLRYYWKLKAVEAIHMSASGCARPPEDVFSKLVDILIDDNKIKDMVIKAINAMAESERYPRNQKEEAEQGIKVNPTML